MYSGYEDVPRRGESPELPRSISTTNLDTTARCRNIIQQDWCPNAVPNGTNFFNATTRFTFTLPSLSGYPPDFQKFTFERIVDKRTQEVLETDRCLNWSPSLAKLIPLYTMGDGNCLLHAASLAMWGFQDRDFILRKAVHAALRASDNTSMLYQRWKFAREVENKLHSCELDPSQWQREWMSLIQQSSPEPALGMSLASLEEFHVFVLANILKRPIIMYSPTKMRSFVGSDTLQPGTFHGVYLPLLWDSRACAKDPLSLAFNGGHFSALVMFEDEARRNEFLLPLSDCYGQEFPVKFMHPVEKPQNLIKEYFDFEMVQTAGNKMTSCARLKVEKVPAYISTLISGFIDACSTAYQQYSKKDSHTSRSGNALCLNGCGLYGDTGFQGFCSRCYRERMEQKARPSPPMSSTLPPPIGINRALSQPTSAIKCPTCSNPGHPSYLGMCEACFKKQQSGDLGAALRRQGSGDYAAGKPANARSSDDRGVTQPQGQQYGGAYGERRRCGTSGCEFFGTAETNFYCSKCSKTMNPPSQQPPRPVPAPRTASQPQRSVGEGAGGDSCYKCRKFCGSPEYAGLCHGCFMEQTKESDRMSEPPSGRPLQGRTDYDERPSVPSVVPRGRLDDAPLGRSDSTQGRTIDGYTAQRPMDAYSAVQPGPQNRSRYPNDLSGTVERMSVSDRGTSSCFACERRDPTLLPRQSVFTVCYNHALQLDDLVTKGTQRPGSSPSYVGAPSQPSYAGASGGGEKPLKLICKVAGCSFRGVAELGGLCPNCYRDEGGVTNLKAE